MARSDLANSAAPGLELELTQDRGWSVAGPFSPRTLLRTGDRNALKATLGSGLCPVLETHSTSSLREGL